MDFHPFGPTMANVNSLKKPTTDSGLTGLHGPISHTHTRSHTHAHTHTHTTHTQYHQHSPVTQARTHTHAYTPTHTQYHQQSQSHTCTHTRSHTHTHMHTRMHTHTIPPTTHKHNTNNTHTCRSLCPLWYRLQNRQQILVWPDQSPPLHLQLSSSLSCGSTWVSGASSLTSTPHWWSFLVEEPASWSTYDEPQTSSSSDEQVDQTYIKGRKTHVSIAQLHQQFYAISNLKKISIMIIILLFNEPWHMDHVMKLQRNGLIWIQGLVHTVMLIDEKL